MLFAAHLIIGAYVLMYIFIPGYMIPFFKVPSGRVTVLLCIVLFLMHSVFFLILPEPESGIKRIAIKVYWKLAVGVSLFLALFGPSAMSL